MIKIDVANTLMDGIILERHVTHHFGVPSNTDCDGVIAYVPATNSIEFCFQEDDMPIPYSYHRNLQSLLVIP